MLLSHQNALASFFIALSLFFGLACSHKAGSSSHHVAGLRSAFYNRGGDVDGSECTVIKQHKEGLLPLTHSFGGGGGGEVWEHDAVIVVLDHLHLEADGRHGREGQVNTLRLHLRRPWIPFAAMEPKLYVQGVQEVVKAPSHWEVQGRHACPTEVCLMPAPEVNRSTIPACGWAPPQDALSLHQYEAEDQSNSNGNGKSHEADRRILAEVDISPFLQRHYSSLKIFSIPTALASSGMWQTHTMSLESVELRYDEDPSYLAI
mmetsp:Transcript_15975/g.34580  ORF Transcript_15975/g.34580 Transcript_15975/m.34580 type:complete len:261 (-) Transcript_15975:46-828(-)|eukprot:CAMPEP_0206567422 /NCGR_PEP_ID=MMETSP0325_2-20121206/25233_1 /ASSEMBLY_ACC=CAM_ASM_000347 /TAXON_ID=2866 /ORGANISM="Crypthecodinium cohnii, Strain Seligo" /LENGTH=260 /DNA_ID=CAMNT_0054070617 /DNA_START=401 /DNA_END=1183 /DNA_ORIENTATION=-